MICSFHVNGHDAGICCEAVQTILWVRVSVIQSLLSETPAPDISMLIETSKTKTYTIICNLPIYGRN